MDFVKKCRISHRTPVKVSDGMKHTHTPRQLTLSQPRLGSCRLLPSNGLVPRAGGLYIWEAAVACLVHLPINVMLAGASRMCR